jgi:hypothetical protein
MSLHLLKPMNAEFDITQYSDICDQIKILEKRKEELKKQLVERYFINTDTLFASTGLILATYKASIRILFKQTEFKLDHAQLFDDYAELKEIRTLLLK